MSLLRGGGRNMNTMGLNEDRCCSKSFGMLLMLSCLLTDLLVIACNPFLVDMTFFASAVH